MIYQELDLYQDLKDGSDVYEHVIFGTFSFDPDFFEEKILPILKYKEAKNVIVLTDRSEYQRRFSDMKSAGREYYIQECYASKTFHPKFMLATWDKGIKLVIGSANLKKQSWFNSAELVASIEFNTSSKDDEHIQILTAFRKFLTLILEKKYIRSEKHQNKIQEIIKELKKLPTSNNNNKNSKLIHNLEKPILDQVKEIIGSEKIKQVKILAPFFNEEGSVIEYLIKNGCDVFDIFVQPNEVENFPKEVIKKLIKQGKKIRIHSIKSKTDEGRYFHAKSLILNTETNAYCLFGSANPTYSGMCSLPSNGNLELCILSKDVCNYFDNLVSEEMLVIKEITVDDISSKKQNRPASHYEKIRILDAYLDKKVLKIQLDYDEDIENGKILLCHHDGGFLEISIKPNEKLKFEKNLNEKEFRFCNNNSTYVKIKLEKNGNILESGPRVISTQELELAPKKADIKKILDSNGRFGLITFLNKLEKYYGGIEPEWFNYYLQKLNFDKLERLEPMRRKLMDRKTEFEESGYEIAPTIKINETILETLKQKFSKIVDFDRFLYWSKLTVWFYTKFQNVNTLVFINQWIEKYTRKYAEAYQNKEISTIDSDKCKEFDMLRLLEHLLVFSFLIYKFHEDAGWYNQWEEKKHPERKIFDETATDLVKTLELRGKEFLKEDFENEMKKYYDEFEDLEISFEDLSEYYEKIRDGLSA